MTPTSKEGFLGYLGVNDLASSRAVCKFWKQSSDTPDLWHNLLCQLKGREFTSRKLAIPRNFLRLDQILTKAFQEVKQAKEITLSDLDGRAIKIVFDDQHEYHLQLPKDTTDVLENTSCLDYQPWLGAIRKVAETIASMHIGYQLKANFAPYPEFVSVLNAQIKQPDSNMQRFIQDNQISTIFILKNGDCFVTAATKSESLTWPNLRKALLEGSEPNNQRNAELFSTYYSADGDAKSKIAETIQAQKQDISTGMAQYLLKIKMMSWEMNRRD